MIGPAPAGIGREIQLLRSNSTYLVSPAGRTAGLKFDPFPLPRFPLSLAQWLISAGNHFDQERNRAVAFTILFDPQTHHWAAVMPTQACGRTSVRWSLIAQDYAEFPQQVLVIGSFHSVPIQSVMTADRFVPPFDGVHLLVQPRSAAGAAITFLRCQGQITLADPSQILADDTQDVFRRYADRLRLPESC